MQRKFSAYLLFALLFLTSTTIVGQDSIFMTDGTVTTCEGSFQDDNSGGNEGSPYSDTDYTFTICPDSPGDVIQIEFFAFNLQTSPNYNNSDFLTIYDGDNTGEASLGSYTGSQLQGLSVTGTINNISGCLTFVLNVQTGNTNGLPGWEGLISCTTPCATPISMSEILDPEPISDTIASVGVCMGQEITFADAGSFAQDGFDLIQYIWNFNDGVVDTTSGLQAIHSFDEPGEYIVTLTVEDDNGCQSLNLEPLQVLVSTIPTFNTSYSEQICLGGTGFVDGSPIQSETWTALPPQVVSGQTYLADGAGFSYSSSLIFDYFDADAVLEDCDDFLGVVMNMEHTYLGDLLIQLECPDGTTVTMLDWPNNGGGTFLGEAVDDGTNIEGVGYDYGWAPGLTNGNLDDNNSSSINYTNNAGQNVTANIVDPGLYQSDNDLCDFVGCPLNGAWTFTVVDNLAIDNGYIFEWGLNFNPELYPGVTTFTPEIGLDLDSSYWEGDYIIDSSIDGNYLEIEPPALGEYDYIFYATNNFGCTFDTTITIPVVNGPVVDAGPDVAICDDFQLDAQVTSEFIMPPCLFTLELTNTQGPDWGWGSASVDVSLDGVFSASYAPMGFPVNYQFEIAVQSGQEITLSYNEDVWGTTGIFLNLYDDDGALIFTSDVDPPGGEMFSSTIVCLSEGQLVYDWTPGDDLSATDIPNPEVLAVTEPTTYTITVYPDGQPGCASSDDVVVSPVDIIDPGENTEVVLCPSDDVVILTELLDGTPDQNGVWFDINDNEIDSLYDPSADVEGVYTYLVGGELCGLESELDITLNEFSFTTSPDTTVCIDGTLNLYAIADFAPIGDLNFVWNGGEYIGDQIEIFPTEEEVFTVFGSYGDGCFTDPQEVEVSMYLPLEMTLVTDGEICAGDLFTVAVNEFSGGLAPYTFSWTATDGSLNNLPTFDVTPLDDVEYCLEFADACETPVNTGCVFVDVEEPISTLFEADSLVGCEPFAVQFFTEHGFDTNIAQAEWDFGDGNIMEAIGDVSHNYLDDGIYTVTYNLVSQFGCLYGDTLEDYITVYRQPLASISVVEQTAVLPNTSFEFINYSIGNDYNLWTFEPYGFIEDVAPEFTYPVDNPGTFEVSLYIENEIGCADSTKMNVFITQEIEMYIPNAFTPDGDGINEYFFVQGFDIDESHYEMWIYDRWGEAVFATDDYYQGWDGSHQGGDHFVPDGIYVYRIETRSVTTGEDAVFVGHVTILR
jgi:gliding motility-associated-like protein